MGPLFAGLEFHPRAAGQVSRAEEAGAEDIIGNALGLVDVLFNSRRQKML